MDIQETGFLLRVENYEKCLEFYSKVLELPIRLQKPGLTNFQFGGSYLLLEKAWEPTPKEVRERKDPPFILRINVKDVKGSVERVNQKGIGTNYYDFDWGEVGNFRDPGGNLVEFCRWK